MGNRLIKEELVRVITERVLGKLNELTAKQAAMVQGAIYNANMDDLRNQTPSAEKKIARGQRLKLPAIDKALNDNFKDVEIAFKQLNDYDVVQGVDTIIFHPKKVVYVHQKRFVLGGDIYMNGDSNRTSGYIEYNIPDKCFYRVSYSSKGTIRRQHALGLFQRTYDVANRLISFILEYYEEIAQLCNYVNNNQESLRPSKS